MGFLNVFNAMRNVKIDENAESGIPKAPFLYVNDPTPRSVFVSQLASLIPKTLHVALAESPEHSLGYLRKLKSRDRRDTVFIFADQTVHKNARPETVAAQLVRRNAIRVGSSFASIYIHFDQKCEAFDHDGTHLDIRLPGTMEHATNSEVQDYAQKIYQWLFSALTPKDTLHLIPDEQMRQINTTPAFQGYQYCPLSQCQNIAKDAQIQFVVLIVTKPTIVGDNKLAWQVADKTGVANFFFKHRGPSSQATWDWVLTLEPGQRKSLPRLPCVLVKENLLTTITKSPGRIPDSVIQGTSDSMRIISQGLSKVGRVLRMGQR